MVEALDDEDLFISVISTGEILRGIVLLKQSRRKLGLKGWLQDLERAYADRILAINVELKRATYGVSSLPPPRAQAGL